MTNARRASRGHPVTRYRWMEIIGYAIAGAFVFNLGLPIGASLLAKVLPPPGYHPWFVLIVTLLFVFVVAFVVAEPLRIRRKHWEHIGRYPPLWLALVLSVVLIVGVDEVFPPSWRPLDGDQTALGALLTVVGLFVAAVALRQLPWRRPSPSRMVVDPAADALEWEGLKDWFAKEEPTERDLFDHALLSARIARTLLDTINKQSIALLGPYGSGKSSILARVRHELEESDNPFVIVAEFNGWAVPQPADAPRVALERTIEALGGYIDVQQFRGLPEAYKRLVSAEPSGLLTKILGETDREPLAQLQRLEPVLDALDAHVVLFVEDADRAGDWFDNRHLARLLATLRAVKHVTFILSIDPRPDVRLDYRKLCDIIELVPNLDHERVFAILERAYRTLAN